MKYTYLLIDLGALLVPLIYSFHPKVRFWKEMRRWLPAILLIGTGFVVWDVFFTEQGVWGFNPDYLIGVEFLGLPIEEILFFFCIPFACLFTYHCFRTEWPDYSHLIPGKWVSLILLLMSLALSIVYMDRMYTVSTFLVLGGLLLVSEFVLRADWLKRFFMTYLVILLPFFITNGLLTGTGLESEVVWYNDNENLGLRLLTIPVEDVFYGMALILGNVLVFESLRKNAPQPT